MRVVKLQITTWRGRVTLAEHYYGTLNWTGVDGGGNRAKRSHRLERPLSAAEAAELNRQDNTPGLYEAGSPTERFDSELSVRCAAVRHWVDSMPDSQLLLEQDYVEAGPAPVLAARDAVLSLELMELHRRAQECGWWERGGKTMTAVAAEWDTLIDSLKEEDHGSDGA